MKKITIKISDELATEFNQTVKRRCTTQKKAFEVMLRDWLHPLVPERAASKFADELSEHGPGWRGIFGWRRS